MMDQIQKRNINSSHNVLFLHTGGAPFSLLRNQSKFKFSNTCSNVDVSDLLKYSDDNNNDNRDDAVDVDNQHCIQLTNYTV